MFTIEIPKYFESEKKYVFDVIFKYIFDVEYEIIISNKEKTYNIKFNNILFLKVEDHFFGKFNEIDGYLDNHNLPLVKYIDNLEFTNETTFISLYHNNDCNEYLVKNNNFHLCKIDFIAATFFMLTRWEDYICEFKDKHNRVSGLSSIAHKYNFLDRPIVNEYIEFLWNIIKYYKISVNRKNFKYQLIPTHDVDTPFEYLYLSPYNLLRQLTGDIFKRNSILLSLKRLKKYFLSKYISNKYDPFNTFEEIIALSDKFGVKSYFNFFGGKSCIKFDCNYNLERPEIINLLRLISKKGHYIGLHPSYYSYKNEERINIEYRSLRNKCDILGIKQNKWGGRQHYLKWDIIKTAYYWDKIGLDFDSSLGYYDSPGFRCGICYPFPIFDFVSKKQLKLIEYPLIAMECSYFDYKKLSYSEAKQNAFKLQSKVKKYNGNFIILWHNDKLAIKKSLEYKLYIDLLINN